MVSLRAVQRSSSIWTSVAVLVAVMAGSLTTKAQILWLPNRPPDAPSGSAFGKSVADLSLAEREARVEAEVLRGNVPEFLRRLRPITIQAAKGETNTVTFFVTPDYVAIGSDKDFLLMPMTPQTAQRIADATGCLLPTRKMVDDIYAAAEVKLIPAPIPPSGEMTSVAVFAQHNEMVRTQRLEHLIRHPFGSLVAGHKKDVVLSNRLKDAPDKVSIYGWHRMDGKPIQPLYTGHANTWVDYSQCVRLVQATMTVNGEPRPVADVLQDPKLAALVSNEGPLSGARYPTNLLLQPVGKPSLRKVEAVALGDWTTNTLFAERMTTFKLGREVRVQINEPLSFAASTAPQPLVLVLYALPNGNTIEQTAGLRLQPGDDWHFDIQHIAAQLRFIRATDTNRVWVVAYLEASQKSWPAWRRNPAAETAEIPGIVEALTANYSPRPVKLVLAGHSGGGSFIFGYLNGVKEIPDTVERIAFLDANYAYDPAQGHAAKLARWLERSDRHFLSVLAYNDAVALLDGKPFVSATGGTWYRSHLMRTNLAGHFEFKSRVTGELETSTALSNRVQLLLRDNPERKIWHTVQVERNGFIQSMFSGTSFEGDGYEYLGARAYTRWIDP
jgi:hypothetical protein